MPNHCDRCHEPPGTVSDVDLIVNPHNGEMMHFRCCKTPELIADADQEE